MYATSIPILPDTSTPAIFALVKADLLNGKVVRLGRWRAWAGREGHYLIQWIPTDTLEAREGKGAWVTIWTPRTLNYASTVLVESWMRDW